MNLSRMEAAIATAPSLTGDSELKTSDKSHRDKEEIETVLEPEEFVEGGLIGWSTVAGAFIVQFCGFGYSTSFGVYQDFYTRIYIMNESPSTISWIGSVNAFLVVACGLVAGRLYDRGYFYHLIYGGAILISFSLFMLSCTKPDKFYQVFLTQGLGAGIGAGIMYVPSLAVVSHYFHRRRAMAMSICSSGASLGAIIHPIMLNTTINGSLGFAKATRTSAGMVSVLLLIACAMMRTREPRSSQRPAELSKALRKFSRDGAYIISIIGSALFLIGYYYPLFYLQLNSVSHGLSKQFAFYALVILSVSSFVGRLTSGIFVQNLGVLNMVVLSTGCCSILIFSMILIKSAVSVIVIAVFYGFFAGMYIALLAPLLAVLADDLSEIGVRMGIALCFSGIGTLTGPPVDGALLGEDFVWWKPGAFSGLMALLGFFCYIGMLFILYRRRCHIILVTEA